MASLIPRSLSLALVSTMCAVVSGCGGDGDLRKLPKVARASLIECGGKTLVMPPPPGMIRSDGIYGEWDRVIAGSLLPDHRFLGFYSTFEDRVRIERQAPPVSDKDCILYIRNNDEKRDVTPSGLDDFRDDLEDEIDAVTKRFGAQLAKAIDASISTGNAGEGEEPVSVATAGGSSLLGWFGETRHTFGYTVATTINTDSASQAGTIKLVTSTVVALVNGRMLSFQATTAQQEDEGRQWAEETALLWGRVAASANRAYEGPSLLWIAVKILLSVALIAGVIRGVKHLIKMKNEINAELKKEAEEKAAVESDR